MIYEHRRHRARSSVSSAPQLRAALRAVLHVALGACLCQCEKESNQSAEVQCLPLPRVAEPCNDGRYICPQGTACTEHNSPAPWIGHASGGHCEIPTTSYLEPNLLTAGLQLPEFELAAVKSTPGTFVFRASRRTDVVNCALFICPPVLRAAQSHTGRGAEIVNFDECAYARRIFNVEELASDDRDVQFDLASLTRVAQSCAEGSDPTSTLASDVPGPRLPTVTHLYLGCLGFNSLQMTSVTQLIEPSLADLPQFSPLPVENCQTETEGRACLTRPVCLARPDAGVGSSPDAGVCEGRGDIQIGICRALTCTPRAAVGAGVEPGFLSIPLVLGACDAANTVTNRENCFPDPFGAIGTCWGAQCRARCLTDSDCSRGLPEGSSSSLSCSSPPDSLSPGLCLEGTSR